MYLKKVLNQPNLVGTMLITLMVCSGFVYAFAFDGFNVETAIGGEVEAWLAAAGGGSSGSEDVVCDCLRMPGQPIDRACGKCASDLECGDPQLDCETNCIKKTDPKKCSCETGTKCKESLCGNKKCVSP